MHFAETPAGTETMTAVLLSAVKEATRGACHLADVAGRCAAPEREGTSEAAGHASLEAGLLATRALFDFEDALLRAEPWEPPLAQAILALQAAEEAVRAARLAVESRVSRTLRPEAPPGPAVAPL